MSAGLVPGEKVTAALHALKMSCYELGLTLGLAFTNPDQEKRRKNAGDTVRRWEREGAPPWAWLAIRCLFYDRKMRPPA